MNRDPYRKVAGRYDRIFEGMNKGLRLVGIRTFRPSKGMNILDVGCGTGSQLKLYQRYQCNLYGLDSSPSMLEIARTCLGETARLDLGDAARMPYENGMFDLVISMLTLHEMAPQVRHAALAEIKRVLRSESHLLLIDYHPGPYQPLQGWISKSIITVSELAAGRQHFRNYRDFMKSGGLEPLVRQGGLSVEKQQIVAGGTFNVILAR